MGKLGFSVVMTAAERAEYIQSKKPKTWFEKWLPKKKADTQEERHGFVIFHIGEREGGGWTFRLGDECSLLIFPTKEKAFDFAMALIDVDVQPAEEPGKFEQYVADARAE
jgi:hypothetical protein